MLPDELVALLANSELAFYGASRSADNQPYSHRSWAVRAADVEKGTLEVMISERFADGLERNLEDNGRFALTLGETSGSFRAFQAKGRALSVGPATEDQLAFLRGNCERLAAQAEIQLGSDAMRPGLMGIAEQPHITVVLQAEDFFGQTPGPGAGDKHES